MRLGDVTVDRLRAVTVLVVALLLAGCSSVQEPEVIIPAGVVSVQTADDVIGKTLAEIAANERTLGRTLAPARIIRVQLLRAGEVFELRRLDGTEGPGGMSPNDGPGLVPTLRSPSRILNEVGT